MSKPTMGLRLVRRETNFGDGTVSHIGLQQWFETEKSDHTMRWHKNGGHWMDIEVVLNDDELDPAPWYL